MSTSTAQPSAGLLPLFPLQTVLFPGGVLPLKIFEARYLDLMGRCLRSGEPFGVVSLRSGQEAGQSATGVHVEEVGVLARIDAVDAEQPGILFVQCTGLERFRLLQPPVRQPGGLWVAEVEAVSPDERCTPAPEHTELVKALVQLSEVLESRGVARPFRLDEAGWVANRWCELLPLPRETRQRLMALDDPAARLRSVHEVLRASGLPSTGQP